VLDAAIPGPMLAASIVEAAGAHPSQNLFLLHGIYGRGRNWAAIARRLASVRADWRSLLVDLRGHGDSPVLSAPHTLNQAARDVARVALARGAPIHVLLGHSFGGKVALAYAAVEPKDLAQVWLIDSTPAPKVPDGTAWKMLEFARAHPGPFASRREAAAALEHGGVPRDTAAWMASNVTWRDGRYHWRLDFDVMEALLHDFFRQDYWHLIESPPPETAVHIVKATESSLLNDEACARIEEAGRETGRVHLHRVRGGHWVHTDNPDAITTLLARELPAAHGRPRS
jgi:pimeloyl-ACP methyl ester carboxylesterase